MSVEHWSNGSDRGKSNCWKRNATLEQSVLAHSNLQLTSTAFTQRDALLGSNALHCSKPVHSVHVFSSFAGVRCPMRVQKVRFFSASSFLVCEVSSFVRESYRVSCSVQFKMQDVRRSSDGVVYICIAQQTQHTALYVFTELQTVTDIFSRTRSDRPCAPPSPLYNLSRG
jgi:hypothetical protein